MSRLSEQQLQAVKDKALSAHQHLVALAKQRVVDQGVASQLDGAEAGLFFWVLFQLAAQDIEADVDGFCHKADGLFEEIEAYGQEPLLDIDWVKEVTGDKESFNFSTDNLVSDLVTLPRRKRRQKELSQDEKEKLKKEVEAAIIDDGDGHSLEQALAVAHGVDPQHWIDTIKNNLVKNGGNADFWHLYNHTQLSSGELLLGLLLGQQHWTLLQEQFYGSFIISLIG